MNKDKIPREDFIVYEKLRKSGMINMFEVKNVCAITGLCREAVICIMQNYKDLYDKFQPTTEEIIEEKESEW